MVGDGDVGGDDIVDVGFDGVWIGVDVFDFLNEFEVVEIVG